MDYQCNYYCGPLYYVSLFSLSSFLYHCCRLLGTGAPHHHLNHHIVPNHHLAPSATTSPSVQKTTWFVSSGSTATHSRWCYNASNGSPVMVVIGSVVVGERGWSGRWWRQREGEWKDGSELAMRARQDGCLRVRRCRVVALRWLRSRAMKAEGETGTRCLNNSRSVWRWQGGCHDYVGCTKEVRMMWLQGMEVSDNGGGRWWRADESVRVRWGMSWGVDAMHHQNVSA